MKRLLDKGYHVNATIRSASKAEYLKKLAGAPDRLQINNNINLSAHSKSASRLSRVCLGYVERTRRLQPTRR